MIEYLIGGAVALAVFGYLVVGSCGPRSSEVRA